MFSINSPSSLKLNTQSTRPKTSSNDGFQEIMKKGSSQGVKIVSDTFSKGFSSVPGVPQLSAAVSNAATSLAFSSPSIDAENIFGDNNILDNDSSLDSTANKQEKLLLLQTKINNNQNEIMAKSNIIKSESDSAKNIIQNFK